MNTNIWHLQALVDGDFCLKLLKTCAILAFCLVFNIADPCSFRVGLRYFHCRVHTFLQMLEVVLDNEQGA